MTETPIHHVYTYTDVDRAFWAEHLEDWVPRKIIDGHVHSAEPRFKIETITEEMKQDYWVNELSHGEDAPSLEESYGTVYPNREVSCVAFTVPNLSWEIEGANEFLMEDAAKRGWHTLAVVRPTWRAEQIAWWLDHPGCIGVKPYYALMGYDATTRDRYIEASIFDFLPHHQLEVLNDRGGWVTLHVPKAGRLAHPDNIREVQEIRKRYPDIKLVIAHFGRSYTLPHAQEGLGPLADDPGLYFDNSAVLNPEVHRYALEHIGPDRIVYGTDNPIFYMRGRRQWAGRTYTNRTSHDFYFNKERESKEIEAGYTLYMYEALRAFKDACTELGVGAEDVEKMFYGNAARLIAGSE
ncbi:MAG: amidohydrolase [Candidatus Hydrogenedentes bacterium]|nr:amidohydrolase [Candidatus Hydrogenedentota bacterium]